MILNTNCLPKKSKNSIKVKKKKELFFCWYTFTGQPVNLKVFSTFPHFQMNRHRRTVPGYFLLTIPHSNYLNPTMNVTTLLQEGLHSMGCLNILSSVAGCVFLFLLKAGYLVKRCLCLSFYYKNINISNIRRRVGGGFRRQK